MTSPEKSLPIEKPAGKPAVYRLLQDLGHDLRDWSKSVKTGEPIEPVTNSFRNSQWGFADLGGKPSAVCLWFQDIDKAGQAVYYDGNDQKYRNDLLKAVEFSGENFTKNRGRLNAWTWRSKKLEDVVRAAYYKRQPLRVIIVGGSKKDELPRGRGELPNIDEASKAETRGLDPATWWVHSYDGMTGAYRIYRDLPLPPEAPKPDPAELDPGNDPLLQRYLETLDETVREAVIKARVGQGLFREQLIQRWNGKCSVTGLPKATEFLIASHIRPWSLCDTASQRISPANGLLLTPNLDKLFDRGLISFDANFKMMISPTLPLGVQSAFGLSPQLGLKQRHKDSVEYLEWHRELLFVAATPATD
ncbi:HNH endonuclease [Cupriavidus nantongensis]|uniref:HNH endonuclease n=1 Tax=Cupriavidus nantongensis TaxID=1796606 RepID=UPI0022478F90|nr:HNH endonuclease [Cupriavidus nantongensis]